ncbi:DNA repair metallo-beta-lactamase [Arabidopsis suecica]|uniref:DNA repair metallo-beta-lactamase n=1 Tax=Arabidopsis suecica TaxID=45249 RepID=A0A8T1ZUT1_ARASU|nr:DNA repair metallo-beta-lactamase [Arabidopsis suecica]
MNFSDEEEDEDWFGSRFNDGVNEEEEEEEGFVFYDDVEENEEGEGFASDFYKAGSDWSCLVEDEEVSTSEKKKMKQSNLFQIWGLQENSPDTTKKMKQTDLFQSWGLQKPSPFTSPASNSAKKATSALGKRRRDSSFSNDSPRPCPFYKKLPGTPFTVDAFRYGCIQGCSAYFLTHFHADHYIGLTKAWSHGPIYCSSLTSRLLRLSLSVDPSFIHPLELDVEYTINGIKVTLIEANHCPGAALIHFRLLDGTCYLHTGDFRASKQMQTHPLVFNQRVHVLYLDTTYCNPRYKFPSKEDVLSYVVRITKDFLRKQPKTLIVVGSYSIGKECVYLAIAKALGVKIFANASRRRILQSFGWDDISKNLSTDGKATCLHVLPMSSLKVERLDEHLKVYREQYGAVLAFRPTGWTYSEKIGEHLDLIKPTSRGKITIYGVPYSEHSSFTELREFVQFLRPDKIIPTVNNGNAGAREKMQSCFREWLRR